jgi:hypothetical protein
VHITAFPCAGFSLSFFLLAELLTEDFSFKKLKLNTAALKTWVSTNYFSELNINFVFLKIRNLFEFLHFNFSQLR